MAYITNADIESRIGTLAYIQLTDDAGSGAADTAKVDEARNAGEAEVNGYLATRYAVPLDLTNEPQLAALVKSLTLDIAAYRLHSRRPPVPDDIVRRRQDAITLLSRVASGQAQLPAASAPRENPALGVISDVTGPARIMTREGMENL